MSWTRASTSGGSSRTERPIPSAATAAVSSWDPTAVPRSVFLKPPSGTPPRPPATALSPRRASLRPTPQSDPNAGRALLQVHKIKCHTPHAPRGSAIRGDELLASCWSLVCKVVHMGNSGSPAYRARRREREQQRRQQSQRAPSRVARLPASDAGFVARERRTGATTCGWCHGPINPRSRGPIPKWCSATCRHRAWEQARAAASNRSAVDIVERRVEVPVPAAPTRRDWARLLGELTHQLDDGRVYDRDIGALREAVWGVPEGGS